MATNDASPHTAGDISRCPVMSGYNPLSESEILDPYPSYERSRDAFPVFYDEAMGFWSVSRREDVLAIIRDTKRFSNGNAIPMPLPPEHMRERMPKYPFATAVLFLDEPEHRPARNMVQAPFTPRQLRTMAPLIREHAENYLKLDDPDRRLEFVYGYATPLALVVIGKIIGVPKEDFPLLESSIYGAFRIASGVASDEEILELAEGQLAYWEYLCALVERQRANPQDDFSSVLSNFKNEDGSSPTTDEIAAHINTILGAGFETSAQMMSFGMLSMLQNRDQWELLKSDRSLLPQAVEECVRHRSVIKRNFRVALEDVEIDGVTIPKGALIAILMQSTNRDPSAFPEPDTFDITRKQDNLTFGRGMHFCLGAPLSKLEMKVTLEAFLDLAPDAKLVEDQTIEFKQDLRLDGLASLNIDLGAVPAEARVGEPVSV
jgi:cytochrome P450